MKQLMANAQAPQLPPDFASMIDSMSAFAEALKPNPAADKVTLALGDKALGGLVRGWFTARAMQVQSAPNKGGL